MTDLIPLGLSKKMPLDTACTVGRKFILVFAKIMSRPLIIRDGRRHKVSFDFCTQSC